MSLDLYRPQTKFAEVMFLQVSVCPWGMACVPGGWHTWQGVACMAWGACVTRGGACVAGPCMSGGMHGDVHGSGGMCMAGGVCGREGMHARGACMGGWRVW